MSDRLIASDAALGAEQRALLGALVDTIVPESDDGRMPSARELDFADYLHRNAPDFLPELAGVLAYFDPGFVTQPLPVRHVRVKAFSEEAPDTFNALLAQVYGCYYQTGHRVPPGVRAQRRPALSEGQHRRPGRLVVARSGAEEPDPLAAPRTRRSGKMKKAAKILGMVIAGYVTLALALDAFIGVSQIALEPGEREGILRTFDADGTMHETRMIIIDDGDIMWVQSGHHFRGWYYRLIENPNVELLRGDTLTQRRGRRPRDPGSQGAHESTADGPGGLRRLLRNPLRAALCRRQAGSAGLALVPPCSTTTSPDPAKQPSATQGRRLHTDGAR